MPGARKLDDLLRDPRLAIHGATIDQDLVEGDAKLAGTAIATESSRYVEATGQPVSAGAAVFTVDLDLVVLTRVEGDELVIDRWTPRGGHRLVSRT